jgi:hypothetical protein
MALGKKGAFLNWKEILAAVTLSLLILLGAFYFGVIKKECEDETCFQKALQKCTPAKYLRLQNLNYYKYTISGIRSGDCKLTVELKKMAVGTEPAKAVLLEGKGMVCKVPKKEIQKIESTQITGLLNYCSGPLKEGMYQLIIEKLYTLVIANLGDVIGKMEETIKGEV